MARIFPPKVNASDPCAIDSVPPIVKLLPNVITVPKVLVLMIFQITPADAKVVDVEIAKVEPVVMTVPAVYVNVPILY